MSDLDMQKLVRDLKGSPEDRAARIRLELERIRRGMSDCSIEETPWGTHAYGAPFFVESWYPRIVERFCRGADTVSVEVIRDKPDERYVRVWKPHSCARCGHQAKAHQPTFERPGDRCRGDGSQCACVEFQSPDRTWHLGSSSYFSMFFVRVSADGDLE